MSKLYFVATNHDQYRTHEYEPDSVIIDPWRYVPDQPDSKVRRIGQNKPAEISVLMPTRGRPDGWRRVIETCFATATYPRHVEVLCYLDEDDPARHDYVWVHSRNGKVTTPLPGQVGMMDGPRILLSQAWNELADKAGGEIFMHCGDDVTFNTPGWDQRVREEFEKIPDRIGLVFADDLSTNFPELATHGFVHRRWVESVGYFLPPLFSCDWNDVWLSEVATKIGRMVPMANVVIEHHHYTFGKAERDQTHAEREERGIADGVVDLYKRTHHDRDNDVAKLRAVMA